MSSWFETVAAAQGLARRRLPAPVYQALLAGSEAGVSYADNTAAFGEIGFAPHVASLPRMRSLSSTVMGQPISMPVLVSPTGVQAVHPLGEIAVARAAAARGVAMGLSSFASKPMEAVIEAGAPVFFQLCWAGSRRDLESNLERARAAGAKGLILTLDWSFAQGRDWGSPSIPERISPRTMARYAPAALRRPRWLLDFARSGTIPDLRVPNLPGNPTFFEAYRDWQQTPPPTWADVAWLRSRWAGPFMVKGISRVDDARLAVNAGATAISVSNHGGNDLDTIPSPLRLLPSIVDAVGSETEVLLDGGVRRGSDVVKALALGAKAVMIGRAYLWGLAANGQAGVENVLDILRGGIDSTLLGLGVADVADLGLKDVLIPPNFVMQLDPAQGSERTTKFALGPLVGE